MSKNKTARKNKVEIRSYLIDIIAILIIIATIGGICFLAYDYESSRGRSDINISENYENNLFTCATLSSLAPSMSITNATMSTVNFDPSFSELGLYTITLEEFPDSSFKLESCPIWGEDNDIEEINQQTKFKNFNKSQKKMIESARQHVIEYINDSEVFTDKETLIEGIENIPFYLYTESTHEQLSDYDSAAAVHLGNGIYCNNTQKEFFCEYVFVHELVHHLRYLTSDKKLSNERYFATTFDEALTDVITLSMNPANTFKSGYGSPYITFYEPMYKYLAIFGRDALSAYFYGYDEFFENSGGNTFRTEHDAFVVSLAYYDKVQDGIICTEGI